MSKSALITIGIVLFLFGAVAFWQASAAETAMTVGGLALATLGLLILFLGLRRKSQAEGATVTRITGVTRVHKKETPVCQACPSCGGTAASRVKPQAKAAFTKDRICTTCNTRYSPPTPRWAAVLFIVIGAALTSPIVCAVVVWVYWLLRGLPRGVRLGFNPEGIPVSLFFVFLGVIGVRSVMLGVRSLRLKPLGPRSLGEA